MFGGLDPFAAMKKKTPSDDTEQQTEVFYIVVLFLTLRNIRIHYECEDGIVKSIPRIIVWHHKACRVMTNRERERWIFLSHFHTKAAEIPIGCARKKMKLDI